MARPRKDRTPEPQLDIQERVVPDLADVPKAWVTSRPAPKPVSVKKKWGKD